VSVTVVQTILPSLENVCRAKDLAQKVCHGASAIVVLDIERLCRREIYGFLHFRMGAKSCDQPVYVCLFG